MAGAVQQAAELEDVPPELIGQRTPASMFMSAQHVLCCCAVGKDSPGRTGVKEARLTANRANNSRAGSLIARILSRTHAF
jgi:hypothetical protein